MRPRLPSLGPLLAVLAGCPAPAPAPAGPRPPSQQQAPLHPPWSDPADRNPGGAPSNPGGANPGGSRDGSLTGNPDVPIDPAKQMPERSLSTAAALELGKPATLLIDGRADVFSAGLAQPDVGRGGKPPGLVTLVSGGGYLTFSSVKGQIGCGSGPSAGPDGGACAGGNTDIRAAGGISGIIHHEKTQFLVGVFLGPSLPVRAPTTLDFSAAAQGDSFAELAPATGQTFFIGDGVTRSGLNQRFIIPPGATRFYLGFADAFSFQGNPGAYGDNTGGLTVTLTQAR